MTLTMYHITSLSNLEAIQSEGLTAGFGNYMSCTLENAMKFLFIRNFFEPNDWVALEIEVEGLPLQHGTDHDPQFFNTDDSWVVWEKIDPSRIVNVLEVEFESKGEKNTILTRRIY